MSALDPATAGALASRFPSQRILVVGDVMLDHFVVGRVQRISPEAPVPVVEFHHESHRLGGAANVAHNLRALGARADLVGVVGADPQAELLREALGAIGLAGDGLVEAPDRCTTRKMRIVTSRNQQVARIDYERDHDVAGDVERRLVECVRERLALCGVAIVSDYLKGVVTGGLMQALVEEARQRGVRVLVDPKIPHIHHYAGATLVTPNHHEAEIATAMRIRDAGDARCAARRFRDRAGCESVLVTRGEHGMWLMEGRWRFVAPPGGVHEAPAEHEVLAERELPAAAVEVADVTGAGDTVIAAMGLALAAGASLVDAAQLANHAAGIAVARFGPVAVTAEELLASITGS
jgi:D-glycero-beta-D-manno-heptose-7-phosphate kinase